MSRFSPGDVVQAPVRVGERPEIKIRPLVLVGTGGDRNLLEGCPVTSTYPGTEPHLSLDLTDFAEGGLDIFETRYVLTAMVCTISPRDVRGKKGRVTDECLSAIGRDRPRD